MNIQAQYPSMDDGRLAHQARADPQAFAYLRLSRLCEELGSLFAVKSNHE